MGLLGPTTKITPRSAINASFRRVETSADGSRWVFQDVLPGGVAARAGVQPGDALISANGIDIASAQPPAFPMGERIPIVVSRNGDRTEKRLDLATQDPKYKDNPYSEPDSVTAEIASDSLGAVKVSLFPGKIGIDFANHVDAVFREKIPNVEAIGDRSARKSRRGNRRPPSDELSHPFEGSDRLQSGSSNRGARLRQGKPPEA